MDDLTHFEFQKILPVFHTPVSTLLVTHHFFFTGKAILPQGKSLHLCWPLPPSRFAILHTSSLIVLLSGSSCCSTLRCHIPGDFCPQCSHVGCCSHGCPSTSLQAGSAFHPFTFHMFFSFLGYLLCLSLTMLKCVLLSFFLILTQNSADVLCASFLLTLHSASTKGSFYWYRCSRVLIFWNYQLLGIRHCFALCPFFMWANIQ